MRRTQKLAPAPQKPRPKGLFPTGSGLTCCFVLFWLGLAVSETPSAARAESLHAGPLFDEFDLTLAPGHRTEALGPFFYSEQKETQRTWAVPPVALLHA